MRKIQVKVIIFLLINFMLVAVLSKCPLANTIEDEKEFVICIDPGHQQKGDKRGEPIAPNSAATKARVSYGTSGIATKKNEYVVNLEAALILRNILEEKNYNIVMTRESHDVNISNIERAKIANDNNADLAIHIHCDSLNDGSKTGATILVPDKNSKNTSGIYNESYEFANILMKKLKESGVKVNGIFERSDITGFNWSKVPVVIFEMGFMSNYAEDQMLSNPDYQLKLMNCVANALDEYRNSKN